MPDQEHRPAAFSRRALARLVAGGAVLAATGCQTPKRLAAVPAGMTTRAEPALSNIRFWPNRDNANFIAEGRLSLARERAWRESRGESGPLPPVSFLAISGGGDDGAYSAGLLTGWSERGGRPEFKAVTGISTGALIAPFAFLGSNYDHLLRETYTGVSQKDIFTQRGPLAAIFGDAMGDTRPMRGLLQRYVTPEILAAIAAEYAKGRLLLIGTTDLDAREPVIWNMTAIAASSDPAAAGLFRKIVLASASIPGAFPPVMFDVTLDGRRYQEMHVDGGAAAQVFIYPPSVRIGELARAEGGGERTRTLYVIRNARLDPDWASVDRRTLNIAGRAVSSLIQTQGVGDLAQIYMTSRRDGIDYNLAYIGADFTTPHTAQFEPAYMKALFDYGRREAVEGDPWRKFPPGFGPTPDPM
jgi:hypothetical protein